MEEGSNIEKNYSFACVTVRNYNRNLDKLLSETFKKTETSFANSKSQFLIHLIELGLAIYLKKINQKEDNKEIDSLSIEYKELMALFNSFIEYSRAENEISKVNCKVLNLLSSAILGILIDIAEGRDIDIEEIEKGMYDKIPDRFLKILKQGTNKN